ncbi:MAG: hypothetical protein KGJ13_03205 [Patescibacteria group bacterium]|nr:hypothetical protein [Patescibacteria group bacterium]
MTDRKLWKLLKERPWLWAAKQLWEPETTDAKVERMDPVAMSARIKKVWSEVVAGTAKLLLHRIGESEAGFLDDPLMIRQEALLVVACWNDPADWSLSLCASLTQGGLISALCGKVDEIALFRKSPDKVSAEIRVYRAPNGYSTFNDFFMDERDSRKLESVLASKSD